MRYKLFSIISLLFLLSNFASAQTTQENDSTSLPVVEYSTTAAPTYEIAAISVTGAANYEDFALIGYSGLAIGDKVEIPGDAITNAVKRFCKQGLFSSVKIFATKIKDGKVWLNIDLKERPRVSEVNYTGLKKSEIDELNNRVGIVKGNQITPNISDRAKIVIEKYLEEKGFLSVVVNVYQKNDPIKPGYVIVEINVDKKLKTKVHKLIYIGNKALSHNQINRAMKKTNDNNILNFFRSKKFVREEYEKDKIALIEKYNEIGNIIDYSNSIGKRYYDEFNWVKWLNN